MYGVKSETVNEDARHDCSSKVKPKRLDHSLNPASSMLVDGTWTELNSLNTNFKYFFSH